MNIEHRILNFKIKLQINISKFIFRYSILFLILIISSCSNPYKNLTKTEYPINDIQEIPYALPFSEKALIYKANINFYKNDISGLLIIKKTDNNIYRIALTTQFGLKIFDFELNHGILNVKHCIEYLNKEVIIKTFQTDFNLLLMQNNTEAIYFIKNTEMNQNIWQFSSGKINRYYIQNSESEKIENISSKKRNSEKISVGLHNYKANIPMNITLEHHNIKLKMNLKLIQ
ncbi:MAG: hypothetical protein GQ564_22130 [Bacteroidales bacterium]|nr:hypothetical protein [Bacteroidales bacterium]